MARDVLTRILCEELNLRAYAVSTNETVREITDLHHTTPNATYALGRTITATALLSATLKPDSDQSIAVKFSGNGPLREVQVQADARGNIRGYVANPEIDLAHDIAGISFSRSIGAAFITVTKDLGMKEPYTSALPLNYGDVAADIAWYLTVSEQVPSALILGMNLDADRKPVSSGGILIQTFPETDVAVIEKIERNIGAMKYTLGDALEKGNDIFSVLSEIVDDTPMLVLDRRPLRNACNCSKEFISGILSTLDDGDLREMYEKDHGAEVTCAFCRARYTFTEEELREKLRNRGGN